MESSFFQLLKNKKKNNLSKGLIIKDLFIGLGIFTLLSLNTSWKQKYQALKTVF